MKKKIAVYCSSSSEIPEDIKETAYKLGRLIGEMDCILVYGGVNAGLMHEVAKGAYDSNAPVIGVVPEFFLHRADGLCTEIISVSDLNTRKARMISEADLFIVLPGGLGTIDEWISTSSQIMASNVVDENFRRPIVVYNRDGMFDYMIAQFKATNESGFARGRFADPGIVVGTSLQLFETVKKIIAEQENLT